MAQLDPPTLCPFDATTCLQVFAGGQQFMATAQPQNILAEVNNNSSDVNHTPPGTVLQMVQPVCEEGGAGPELAVLKSSVEPAIRLSALLQYNSLGYAISLERFGGRALDAHRLNEAAKQHFKPLTQRNVYMQRRATVPPPKLCIYGIARNEAKHVESFMAASQVRAAWWGSARVGHRMLPSACCQHRSWCPLARCRPPT